MATRAELRRAIGYELKDISPLTVTANGAMSTTLVYATGDISTAVDSAKGRQIIFLTGTAGNIGQIRRITDTSQSTGTITLDRALPAIPAAGDTAELYNFRGKQWTIDQYHHYINRAIADAFPAHKGTQVEEVIGTAFDADSPSVAIPATINYLSAVEFLPDGATLYQTVPMAEDRLFRGWSVDLPNGAIVVRGGDVLSMLDGATIKMIGWQRAQPLSADADTTTVPTKWIVDKCKEWMLTADIEREPNNYNRGMVSREDQTRTKIALRSRGLAARAKYIRD